MEHYTIKNLPETSAEHADDLRLQPAKNRLTFLWCAFKAIVLRGASIIRIAALIIVLIGIIGMLVMGHPWKALALLITLIVVYSYFFWANNKLYSGLRSGNCFPVLTSEGPQNIMDLYEGEFYIRIQSAPWDEVESITFYPSFLAIEMKKESESGFFYMWTDDSGKAKETALTMWRRALNARGENRTLPEYYSGGEMNEVSDFIEETFGEYDFVMHEVVSPDIHLDIAIIPPTDERNYYTLCTMGAGAHRMDVPDNFRYENHIAERIELLMYLPADWDLSEENLNDERNYWPIRLLKDFARMPINSGDWIGWGHTMSQEEYEPFADDVPYSTSILLAPQPDIDEMVTLPISSGKSVNFFQVFPLTKEELEYKFECAEDENCISPTDAMLNRFKMDRDHWIEYALGRYSYRTK